MSGLVDSAGGFLGLNNGPQAPNAQYANPSSDQLNQQNGVYGNTSIMNALNNYSQGTGTSGDVLGLNMNGAQQQGAENALASGATTGTKYAEEQMGNNPTQQSLYGQSGQLGNTENAINQEQGQGFYLQPQDQTLYGQESGQIANQYGQMGNQAANSLASRGLSDSGAAGATFSGIAGNQNQQLANAQQQIAQQRFQNTQQQVAQNQNYAAQLGNQYNSALNQQYGRQLAGAQNQTGALEGGAGTANQANNTANQSQLAQAGFNVANTPMNAMDFATAGAGQGLESGLGGSSGSSTTKTDANGKTSTASTAGSGVAGLFG